MRRLAVGIVAAAATLGVAGTANAAPPERVEVWICDGEEVEITVMGRVGVIDGQRYLAHNLVIEGTFDPAGPAPAQPFTDTQWTSGRTGGLDCTRTFTETDEEGTATVTLTLNAIPIGR
jgi:hypothetical protein